MMYVIQGLPSAEKDAEVDTLASSGCTVIRFEEIESINGRAVLSKSAFESFSSEQLDIIRLFLRNGNNVVLDGCNITVKRVAWAVNEACDCGHEVIFKRIDGNSKFEGLRVAFEELSKEKCMGQIFDSKTKPAS